MAVRRPSMSWLAGCGLACSAIIGCGPNTGTSAPHSVNVAGSAGSAGTLQPQAAAPPAFSGLEGPAPPAPAGGWPSAYPISIYAQRLSVTQHVLTKDGDNTPIDHLWLDANSSQVSSGLKGYFTDTAFLYGAPLELSTKYRVKIVGTHTGGALNAEWTFTTAAKRPFGT